MSAYEIPFFIGLFGSVHCIGMCGPLAFAVPAAYGNKWLLVWDKLIYQAGRTVSYTLLGVVAGLIGRQLWLMGLQQGVSILSGILILLAALSRLFGFRSLTGGTAFIPAVNRTIVYALNHRWGHVFVGMLNGLLPCGLVYLALAGAVNAGTVGSAAGFMLLFGMGTIPLMFIATVSSGFVNVAVRRKLNAVVPYFMLLLGAWFVLRGLNMDIPYLSPQKQAIVNGACH